MHATVLLRVVRIEGLDVRTRTAAETQHQSDPGSRHRAGLGAMALIHMRAISTGGRGLQRTGFGALPDVMS